MRIGSLVLLIWLVIGAVAAGQRHYYTESSESGAWHGHDHRDDPRGPAELCRGEPEYRCDVPQQKQVTACLIAKGTGHVA